MHFFSFALFFSCLFGGSFTTLLSKGVHDNLTGVESRLFEVQILEFLEKIRDILKNGDPENNIAPMEPLSIPFYDFDFILRESRLDGSIGPLLVNHISDFIVTGVQFNVPQFKLTLALQFPSLQINGSYNLHGNIFEEDVNSQGTFLSDTTTLNLDVLIHIGSNLNRTLIKELNVDFNFVNDNIDFTNKNGESGTLDNSYLQPLFYRIRDEYFPLLQNTLTLVGSDVIHDITLDELLKLILDAIQGNILQLIATNLI